MNNTCRNWVNSTQVKPEEKALKVETKDVIDNIRRSWGSNVSIGRSWCSSYWPVNSIKELNTKSIINNIVPSWLVYPEKRTVLIVVIVENMINLIEDATNVADQNEKDKESIEDVVYDIERCANYVVLETIVKYLYLIYFC